MLKDLADTRLLDRHFRQVTSDHYPDPDLARRLNSERSLLLLTVPKSGTTWLRYLLINYGRLMADPAAPPVTLAELPRYSLRRKFAAEGSVAFTPSVPLLPQWGIDYVLFQHPLHPRPVQNLWCHVGPKLSTYRNPLDFLVSCYFFYFVNRAHRAGTASHPRDLIPAYTRYFAVSYTLLRDKVVPAGNAQLVSYESLKREPARVFAGILNGLGVPVDEALLQRCVAYSDASVVAAQEQASGHPIIGNLTGGAFVRDGSIGQWREYFDQRDVDQVAELLAERGCPLEEFQLT